MEKKTNIKKGKIKKSGYVGSEVWLAHRLEGVVKNKAIKSVKKKKKTVTKQRPLGKIYNPNKISKKRIENV